MEIKLCECGCEQFAPIAKHNIKKYGYVKNQAKRFIWGHHNKNKVPPCFNNGFNIMPNGRAYICCRDGTKILWTHIVYSNMHLSGDKIPKGYIIHHTDNNRENDDLTNLQLMTNPQHTRFHMIGNKYNVGNKNRGKAVILIRDTTIMEFLSAREASKTLGLNDNAVGEAIRNKHKVKGWIAQYV